MVSLVGVVKGEASLVGGVQGRGVTCWWCARARRHLLVVCKGEASLFGCITCWWCHLFGGIKGEASLVGVVNGEASLVGGVQGRGVTCWWCARVRRYLLVVSLVGGIKGEASLVGGVQGRGVTCWWCARARRRLLVVYKFAGAFKYSPTSGICKCIEVITHLVCLALILVAVRPQGNLTSNTSLHLQNHLLPI